MRRIFYAVLALILFWWFIPLGMVIVCVLLVRGRVFRRLELADGSVYLEFASSNRFVRNIPLMFYVWVGRMPLVGVSRRPAGAERMEELFAERSGFFTLEFIRRALGTGHTGLDGIDMEYLSKRSFVTDMGIILKTVPSLVLYSGTGVKVEFLKENHLFGVRFANVSMSEAVSLIVERAVSHTKTRISFVNPDCFNKVVRIKLQSLS